MVSIMLGKKNLAILTSTKSPSRARTTIPALDAAASAATSSIGSSLARRYDASADPDDKDDSNDEGGVMVEVDDDVDGPARRRRSSTCDTAEPRWLDPNMVLLRTDETRRDRLQDLLPMRFWCERERERETRQVKEE
jgi:hypothetical protein